jgi:thiosulfate/3-mercaptopyruvate sulfurtransferase
MAGDGERLADAPPRLVGPQWLQEHLDDPEVVPIDVGSDSVAYHRGHVPGAVALSWLDELHEPDRRGVVSQARLEHLLGRRGIGPEDHLVLHGGEDNVFAAYAYWLLRYYRHPRLSLLDGGRARWAADGRPLTSAPSARCERTYVSPGPDDTVRVTRDVLLARYVGAPPGTAVVDCRTPSEFAGRPEAVTGLPLLHHRLAGRVPGAVNVSCTDLFDEHGCLRPCEQLLRTFTDSGVDRERDVAVYCDVGGRSALGWFVLHEVLGYPRVRSYDGGWAEYGSLVGAPVERELGG